LRTFQLILWHDKNKKKNQKREEKRGRRRKKEIFCTINDLREEEKENERAEKPKKE